MLLGFQYSVQKKLFKFPVTFSFLHPIILYILIFILLYVIFLIKFYELIVILFRRMDGSIYWFDDEQRMCLFRKGQYQFLI